MSKSTEIVSYKDRMLAEAKDVQSAERPDVSRITFTGGNMMVNGEPVTGNSADVVILAAGYERAYYPGAYDPDNIVPPACFAQSRDSEATLAPHESVPNPQATSCHVCPLSKFGSAANGKGQACKMRRKLALIPMADATPEKLKDAEIAVAAIPPTSTKKFSSYANKLAGTGFPYFMFGTKISAKHHKTWQVEVNFDPAGEIATDENGDALFAAISAMRDNAFDIALPPFDLETEDAAHVPEESTKY